MLTPEDKARKQIGKGLEKCGRKVQDIKSFNLHALREVVLRISSFVERENIFTEVERRLSVVDELEANLTRAERLWQSIPGHNFSGESLRG